MNTSTPIFRKLVIIGVGLIGGSAALAARRGGIVQHIVGVGRDGDGLHEALALGIIDAVQPLTEAVADADLVLLAIPVGQMPAVMAEMAPCLAAHALITDAGSTKGDVAAAAQAHIGPHLARFVPGHPIAGAEKSGPAAARTELFDHKRVVLTPLPENTPEAVTRVAEFWAACGAQVTRMSPAAHDGIFAVTSHLPHILAFALVEEIANRPNAEELFGFAAGGFRDFSRIAGSSPEMWRDICLANRDAMLTELDAYITRLDAIRQMIAQHDGETLGQTFSHAREARNAWARKHTKTDGKT